MSGDVAILVEALGMSVVHMIWVGVLFGGVVAVLLAALRGASPRLRYGVLLTSFGVMAALPLAVFYVVHHSVRSPADAVVFSAISTESSLQTRSSGNSFLYVLVNGESSEEGWRMGERPWIGTLQDAAQNPVTWSEAGTLARHGLRTLSPWIALLWMVGVLVLSLRLLGGVGQTHRLRHRGVSPLPGEWQRTVAALAQRAGVTRAVVVLQSSLVQVPVVVGWFRPVVLMPVELLTGMPTAQLELLLAHELAHIKRLDPLVNLLQAVVETVLFFHPVVWWLSKELRETRELCCDDLAVEWCGHRGDYAKALLRVAEAWPVAAPVALAANGSPLRRRIERILYGAMPARSVGMPGVAAFASIALAGALVSGLVWAELAWDGKNSFAIDFSDGERQETMHSEEESDTVPDVVGITVDVPPLVTDVESLPSVVDPPMMVARHTVPATMFDEEEKKSVPVTPTAGSINVDEMAGSDDVVEEIVVEESEHAPEPITPRAESNVPFLLAQDEEGPQDVVPFERETSDVETPDGTATIAVTDALPDTAKWMRSDARTSVERPWPDLGELRVNDSIVSEHVSSVLDRWGKEFKVFFHLDPLLVGPAFGDDGRQYETDGMLEDVRLDGVPLPEALDRVLTSLGLTYWYGRPGSAGESSIHPSIWVSTPEVLAEIEAGHVQQFTYELVFVTVSDAVKDRSIERFAPESYTGDLRPNLILLTDPTLERESLRDAVSVALGVDYWSKKNNSALLSTPRITSISGDAWWPGSARKVLTITPPANQDGFSSGELRVIAPPAGGCIQQPRVRRDIAWNPFSDKTCGVKRTAPPSVEVRCDDRLSPEAATWFAESFYPAIFQQMEEVYDPPLSQSRRRVTKRAGRRNAALPHRAAPSPLNPVEVSLHHEGILVGVVATDRADSSIGVRLFSQYRPSGRGPIPWQTILSKYAVREGDVMGFFLSSEVGDENLLVLVRVLREDAAA